MVSPNADLADALDELASLLRAQKGDRFRVKAYQRAARVVRSAPVDLAALEGADIRRFEGIGSAIAGVIEEYQRTGTVALLEQLREQEPPGVGALLRLPLIGLRDARVLAGHGFTDVARLQDAAEDPRALAVLDDRLASRVQESLRRLAMTSGDHTPLPYARRDAHAVAARLLDVEGVASVEVAGEVRRGVDTVDRFDFVIVGDPAVTRQGLAGCDTVVQVLGDDPDALEVLLGSGRRARLWLTTPAGAAATLLCATGDDDHVAAVGRVAAARGADLRPDGLWTRGERVGIRTEAALYEHLGLQAVPPALRSGDRAVDDAQHDRLPSLVLQTDLRGDLHVHSDWSRDGKATLDDMVAAAVQRGYAYVAITDHAENLRINGMSREAVLSRRDAIARLQQDHAELRILDAAELNIGLDGSLDYDLEFLLAFDLGVASIHSHMDRLTPVQTDRILAAIAHPAVHVIGHPTGRIIGHRPAYGIEMRAIAQAAAETGTALEINGSPRRLDLSGELAHAAVQAGALLSLSSDAHSIAELDNIANALPNAQRAWAAAIDVLNSRSLDQLLTFAERKRNRAV